MENKLEEEIVSLAPWMFRYDDWNDVTKTLIGFGFECGDGWYKLLKNLVIKISELDTEKKVRVVQVKEKFGTLRFYTGAHSTEAIDDLIWQAEKLSAETCDVCGGKSKVKNKNGWLHNICDICESDDHK